MTGPPAYARGLSLSAIAKGTGYSRETVRNILIEHGVTLRPHRGSQPQPDNDATTAGFDGGAS